MNQGFDVIGDVHGHADKLITLLVRLGYQERAGVWTHPKRQVIFVGDLIDRGPGQLDAVRIPRAMVDAGTAFVVAGNHEFNAVAFHTPDPAAPGEYLRRHSDKNLAQHEAFRSQVKEWSRLHDDLVDWFKTLPLWLEFDGLRVVHACWDSDAIKAVQPMASEGNSLTDALVHAASDPGSPAWAAIEHLLKGPEVPISPPYLDKGGHRRERARFQWWLPNADRLDVGALIPSGTTTMDGKPYPPLPATPITPPVAPYRDSVPVLYGHYWASGTPTLTSPVTACVDYSAGKGGELVAYRWSGELILDDSNFVSTGQEEGTG